MRPVVVMVTVSDRRELLNKFLRTLGRHQSGMDVFVHTQVTPNGYDENLAVPAGMTLDQMVTGRPLGCHAARVLALREIAQRAPGVYDHYLNVDDDVMVTPSTDYSTALAASDLPGVGFVLTNWCMHLSQYPKRKAAMSRRLSPQVMVYQGGGMAYAEPTAALMRDLDPVPARYDDIWPLTAYLSGRMNYRYSGSLSVHVIRSKGGMSAYMGAEPRPLLCHRWIDYERISGAKVGREYAIPADKHLRECAKREHRDNRRAAGWPITGGGRDVHPSLEDIDADGPDPDSKETS